MRYFEIARPPARHILADAEQRDAAGEPRGGRLRDQWRLGCANSWKPTDRHCNLPGRKTYLIGSHVGGIYRPCVRNSAGEFLSSQPIAANPLFKGPTDDCRCPLPIGIRWIKRGRNCHERVSRVPNGDVEWECQTDVAHCHTDVVGDFVERLSDDVALCVETIVDSWFSLIVPMMLSSCGGGIYRPIHGLVSLS